MPANPIDWTQMFPVVKLCRYDLKQTGLSDAQIEALTDEDMEVIAEQLDCFIEDYYFNKGIWEQVFRTATMRLEFGNMFGGTE